MDNNIDPPSISQNINPGSSAGYAQTAINLDLSKFRHRSNSFCEFRSANLRHAATDKSALLATPGIEKADKGSEGEWTEVTTKRKNLRSPELSFGKLKQAKLDGY